MAFVFIDVSLDMENKAAGIREKRDEQYGNIYEETDTDIRWVGDLGEICFNTWLKNNNITNFDWHLENTAGKPDFTINGTRIDVKTVKRKVPPRLDYTAQITAQHIHSPVDELFFCSYEYQIKRMWLLGGIEKSEFIKKAIFYKAGDKVHENYTIRKGHEIYNTALSHLIEPNFYVDRFKN